MALYSPTLATENPRARRMRLLRTLQNTLVALTHSEPSSDPAVRQEMMLAGAEVTALYSRRLQLGGPCV